METTALAAEADDEVLREVILSVSAELDRIWDDELSPPAVSAPLYHLTGRLCGCDDPFLPVKVKYTQEALRLLPDVEARILSAPDPFAAAVRTAIAGNVIDFGTGGHSGEAGEGGFKLEDILEEFLEKPLFMDNIRELKDRAEKAGTILVIGDNAGETVFDRPLLKMLKSAAVVYAARDVPIINDATVKDARLAGVQNEARLVSSGSRMPGIVLEDCSAPFRKLFEEADVIIAKGQGNFETLTELCQDGRIFMLFSVKCPVAAHHLGASMGDMMVMQW